MFDIRSRLKSFIYSGSDPNGITDILEPVANKPCTDPAPPIIRRASDSIDTIISQDIVHTGNLVTKGVVNVDGVIQGDMRCDRLLLGQGGEITGAVVADEAVLAGHVRGNIYADLVAVKSTARIRGDIYHKELSIEFDAVFEGRSHIRELA